MPVAKAQKENYYTDIQHYSVAQGLPYRDQFSILMDEQGFIWTSSKDGFSRFDGYRFKNYIGSKTGLFATGRTTMRLDHQNCFWVSSNSREKSLLIYNPRTDSILPFEQVFHNRSPFKSADIVDFARNQDTKGPIVFKLKTGDVYIYNGSFSKINIPDELKQNENLLSLDQGKVAILIMKDSIIYELDRGGQILDRFPMKGELKKVFALKNGSYIIVKSRYPFGITPLSTPLLYIKHANKPVEPFQITLNGKPFRYPYSMNAELTESGDGWLYGFDKMYQFNEKGEIFREITLPTPHERGYKPQIAQLLIQSKDLVWATTTDGIYKVHIVSNRFENVLQGLSVRGMIQTGDSLLVNAYYGDKVVRLSDLKVMPGIFETTAGMGITKDQKGNIYVGNDGVGLTCIELDKKRKTSIVMHDFQQTHAKPIFPFFDPVTQKVYIGTSRGLYYLDTLTNQTVRLDNPELNSMFIRHIYRNQEGLWLGTQDGVFLVNNEGETIMHIDRDHGLPAQIIGFIHEDADGVFWLAAPGSGLIRWTRKLDKSQSYGEFTLYDREAGIANNNVYSILPDKLGFLWLSSDYGLIRFKKESGQIVTFLPSDGLPHEEFNGFSALVLQDGRMAFGGLNGITIFDPNDFIVDEDQISPFHISNISLYSGNDPIGKDKTIDVLSQGKIIMDASDRNFEIQFALLDFVAPASNQYAYFIDGLEKAWNYTKTNSIRLSGLPPGAYTLRIKAQGQNGVWSQSQIVIPIIVKGPFYQDLWFWVASLVVMSVFSFWRYRRNLEKLKMDRELLEKEVALRTATISEQAESLRSLDKAKNRFFTNLTHEFRTPLTLILAPIEAMMKKAEDHEDKVNLQFAYQNAQKLVKKVSQLLDVAKIEAGKMKVSPLPGDAVLFLNHLVESFRPLAIRNQIYLHFGSNPNSIQALLDYQMMETILSNLISNSIKYCTSGDIIHVSLVMEKQVLIWIVSDTGKGIATEELPHIFDPFFRAQSEENNEIEGSGIGLALVKDLIALMGGTIQAKSKPGLGTSFVCTVPFVPVTNLEMEEINFSFTPELVNDSLISAEQPDEAKAEILIVEDNPEMSMFLHLALQKAYNVHLAANGQEGFGLALAHTPDLIITDAMMPEMDGFEFTRMVKDDIRVSHVPVIMLTAKTGLEHLMESLDSGVDAFMTKPFRLDELLLRVKKLLELRKILRYKWSGTSDQNHEDSNKSLLPEREALFLQEVRHIILDHLAEPELKGDFIGKKLGMSRMNLHRKLKSLIDTPVTDLIRDIRLEEASKILLSDNFHIAEVAYQTGFSSPALFTTSFKAKFGKAPSDWVKESQSK